MRQIAIALITVAAVVATIVGVDAEHYDTCQTINGKNLAKCVFENSQRGGD